VSIIVSEDTTSTVRDQARMDERFNPGPRPSDEVVVDPDAPPAPDIGHPEGKDDPS